MNVEIEIKVKLDTLEDVKRELSKFGKLIKDIRQIDEYNTPCQRDFFVHKPSPVEWLRIRTNPDGSVFEYDKSIEKEDGLQDYAEEYETGISNPDEFRKILNFLDFKKIVTIDKQRQYWDCGDFEVCLDKVKDLGFFIEVEAKGDVENTEKAREGCFNFLEKLGIKDYEKNLIKEGYPVSLLKLKKENS